MRQIGLLSTVSEGEEMSQSKPPTETVSEQDVLHIAETVCDTLLDVKVSVQAEPSKNAEASVSRQVRLKGGWNGSVKVECSEPLARHAASVTFGGAPQDATDDDLKDVVGEIANMVGGNMKALMPGPTQLTLPESPLELDEEESHEPTRTKRPSLVLQLEARGEPLTVSVCEDED